MPKKPTTPSEPTQTLALPDDVSIELVDLTPFQPATINPNKGNPNSVPLIKQNIEMNGIGRPMFADKNGQMIGGSHTRQAIEDLRYDKAIVIKSPGNIPIIHQRTDVDIESAQGRSLQIGDNVIANKGYVQDDELMAALLGNIAADDARLVQAAGFEESDVRALMESIGQGEAKADPGAQVDKAAQLQEQWQVERGDLWAIGKHRLLCGDSTNADDVARVMGGQLASLVVTDPPYGVEYADKNAFLNAIARGNRIQEPIAGDHQSKENTQAMWKSAFREMANVMSPGAVVYCFMPQGGDQMMMMMMMMGAGIEPRHELIWLKNNHVLGRVDYAYKHEPILYAWKEGGHHFYGDFQTSILEFDKPHKSDLHPTMKPVELIARLIENSSQYNEVVYDPFGGSGTTMVACEQLSRQCRMIEISEKYCAVILQRMSDMGLTPQRVDHAPRP